MAASQSVDSGILKKLPVFRGLNDTQLAEVSRSGRKIRINPESYLFMQGDPADRFFLVLEGKIKMTQVTEDGRQVIMGYITAGEVMAIVAALSFETYPASAQSVETTTLLGWDRKSTQELIMKTPQLALNVIAILGTHVLEYQNRLRELATERVERRIARTLLRLARQTGRKTEAGVLIDMPLTRQDLAEMTGTTLFTVSRTLSQWESQGLVHSGREQITIRRPHGLVSIAEDLPTPEE